MSDLESEGICKKENALQRKYLGLKVGIMLFATLVILGAAVTIAIAQSGSGAFSLNSPASYPVDI